MINWIFSISLYFITIFWGFYLDGGSSKAMSIKRSRVKRSGIIYLIWLYVFLCFGYMTGSDWFIFERVYLDFDSYSNRYASEPASWMIFKYGHYIISDFWLFYGLAKCAYLFSLFHLLSKITENKYLAVALLIPCQLGILLIQNPFRFMLAAICINYALFILYDRLTNKKTKSQIMTISLLILFAACFHNACILYIVLFPILLLVKKIERIDEIILFVIYLLLTYIFSDVSLLYEWGSNTINYLLMYVEMKDYAQSYLADNEGGFFTIGNIFRIVIFAIVLLSKKKVVSAVDYGNVIYGLTIAYLLIVRVFSMIPTGFRYSLPFATFYVVYIIYMKRTNKILAHIVILYILFAFGKKLWTVYDMIPYSNSIPYILTNHLPYNERVNYNPTEYYKRTGETPDILIMDIR